jgi:hypothetical protein
MARKRDQHRADAVLLACYGQVVMRGSAGSLVLNGPARLRRTTNIPPKPVPSSASEAGSGIPPGVVMLS